MKEFVTKRGGRYLFNDDFDNLQDTISAIASFFSGLGQDFVISGCELDGNYLNGGYVFLDGKIRKVERTDVSGLQPPYCICAYDVEYTRPYKDEVENIVAVDYKTQIVESSSNPDGEYIESDSNGVFLSIIDTFWNHYVAVDNGDDVDGQDIDYINSYENIRIKNCTFNGTNGTQVHLSIKNDGTFVMEGEGMSGGSYGVLSRVEIGSTGMPVTFYDKNDDIIYQIGTKEGVINFILLLAYAINGQSIDAAQYSLNGTDIHSLYFSQQEYIDTGWRNIINTSTDQPVDGFFARRIMDIVYIQGTLPSDFIQTNFNNWKHTFTTKYKLPDLSIDGDSYLPDELNFCHFHTLAYINYTDSLSGAIDSSHMTGCAIRLNNNGVFCIHQGIPNGKAEGLFDNSFPIYNINYNGDPVASRMNIFEYDEAIRPHVSWQYAVNTGLVATNVRYVYGNVSVFNPAPGYIVNDQTYSGNIIHTYCLKNKYVNPGNGERLEKTWRFDLIKMQYRLKTKHIRYLNIWYLNEEYFTYDTDWIDVTPVYDSDWVDYEYYTSYYDKGWDMHESSGIHFVNPDPTKYCEVALTYRNDELGETIINTVEIQNDPDSIRIDLYPGNISSNQVNGKYVLTGLHLIAYEKYYYESQSAYGSYSNYFRNGERYDNMTISIVEGSQYVDLDTTTNRLTPLIFKQAAISASSKFKITVRVTLNYKGMSNLTLYKDASIEIDPTYYTIQNNS